MRATTSVPPPAGNGTIIRIGRCGQFCATDGASIRFNRPIATASVVTKRFIIASLVAQAILGVSDPIHSINSDLVFWLPVVLSFVHDMADPFAPLFSSDGFATLHLDRSVQRDRYHP
jgi:hypothetical protein